MPTKDNVTRPVLLIGAGRTSSSYVQDRLQHGLGLYHTVIENDLYRDTYKVLAQSGWSFRYKYVGDEAEVKQRIISSMRNMFSTIFANDMPGWSMKCIWDNHDPDLLHELFPDAHYIHLLRDPRTNIPSMMERLDYSEDYGCKAYVESNQNAMQFEKFGDRYIRIRQEDFVDSRSETWAKVCAFLRTPFVDGVWERELNASQSTQGKVGQKRSHDRWTWNRLPESVRTTAESLGYTEGS